MYKLLAYAALYVAENRVSFPEEDVTAWLVASKTPVKLLRRYKGLGLLQRLEEGVYLVAGFPFRVFVVAIGELRVEPENYPFLIFSSGRTLREFLRRVIRERNQEYLSIGFLGSECSPRSFFKIFPQNFFLSPLTMQASA